MTRTQILLIHFICCVFMTGLIWTIQVVHYPSFQFIGADQSSQFHQFHSSRISWIVMPMMSAELFTAAILLRSGGQLYFWNLASVIAVWGITGLISVPIHNRLGLNFNPTDIDLLVNTNWLRTFIWSMRTVGLGWLINQILAVDRF